MSKSPVTQNKEHYASTNEATSLDPGAQIELSAAISGVVPDGKFKRRFFFLHIHFRGETFFDMHISKKFYLVQNKELILLSIYLKNDF